MRTRGVLSDYAAFWNAALRVTDALTVLASGGLASLIYLGGIPDKPGYVIGLILALLLCLVIFPSFGLYRTWRGASLWAEARVLSLAWLVTTTILASLAFVTKTGEEFSRVWFLLWLAIGWIVLLASRIALRAILYRIRLHGYNTRRVAVVGDPDSTDRIARHLAANPWLGLTIVARFPIEEGPAPVYEELVSRARSGELQQVWIAVPLRQEAYVHGLQQALRHIPLDFRYIPDISGFSLLNQSVSDMAGLPAIHLTTSGMDSMDRLLKRTEDILGSLLVVLLTAPLMVMIAAGIKLSSPGPVLFRQKRAGLGGETIDVLKFRTMRTHDEPEGSITQARRNDPRVTRFGAFLRRSSLDELPQFFNVIAGDMSIVGPRPHALAHNELYKVSVSRYMTRHIIKPGITGWAQVNGLRGETQTLDQMQKRIDLDLHYIQHWSIGFDLKIIWLTILHGFDDDNAY